MNSYKYILLATDFSKPAKAAAKRAAEIATCYNSRLCLLHVVDHFPEDISNNWIAPEDQSPTNCLAQNSSMTTLRPTLYSVSILRPMKSHNTPNKTR